MAGKFRNESISSLTSTSSSRNNSIGFLRMSVVHIDLSIIMKEELYAVSIRDNPTATPRTFYKKFGQTFDSHPHPGRSMKVEVIDRSLAKDGQLASAPILGSAEVVLSDLMKKVSKTEVKLPLEPGGKLTLRLEYIPPRSSSHQNSIDSNDITPKTSTTGLFRRKAARPEVIVEVLGHKFKGTLFKGPTYCSHCNGFLYGVVSYQGYKCIGCNIVVHRRCVKSCVLACVCNPPKNIAMSFNVPHKFKKKWFHKPTWCAHDGSFLFGVVTKQGVECQSCKIAVHHKCQQFVPATCGLNHERLSAILAENPAIQMLKNAQIEDEQELNDRIYCEYEDPVALKQPIKVTVKDFDLEKIIGKGMFGVVYMAKPSNDLRKRAKVGDSELDLKDLPQHVAIKALRKDKCVEPYDLKETAIERKVLQLAWKSRFLVKMFASFQSDSHLFFCMELMTGGDLMYYAMNHQKIPLSHVRFYVAEIICALQFLHQNSYIYRDLKLDNVLLDAEGHAKLADFGLCADTVPSRTKCGTRDYMAPEVIQGLKYGFACDFWSLGVLAFEFATQTPLFTVSSDEEILMEIRHLKPSRFESLQDPPANRFVQELLETDERLRLGSYSSQHGPIREHAFFHGFDWKKLEKGELEPPFVPRKGMNFDQDYAHMSRTLSKVDKHQAEWLQDHKDIFNNFDAFYFTSASKA